MLLEQAETNQNSLDLSETNQTVLFEQAETIQNTSDLSKTNQTVLLEQAETIQNTLDLSETNQEVLFEKADITSKCHSKDIGKIYQKYPQNFIDKKDTLVTSTPSSLNYYTLTSIITPQALALTFKKAENINFNSYVRL